jgi:hypothetical protein
MVLKQVFNQQAGFQISTCFLHWGAPIPSAGKTCRCKHIPSSAPPQIQ